MDILLDKVYYSATGAGQRGLTTLIASPLSGFPTGSVLSLQPDGTWQSRPAGANGDFESCLLSGGVAIYRPNPHQAYTKDHPDAYYAFAAINVAGL